jgi:ribosome-associated toxin RatA of RatAB toxin-antitoxin module
LVTAPIDTVWQVATDYNNFKAFLPGVVSSRILSNQGNRVVFEQVNVVKVLLFSQKNRVVMIADKQYPRRIDFRLKEGEIKSLNGVWKLDPVSATQVLVTQNVTFDPGKSVPRGLAFRVYRNALMNSLKAIKQETERRFAQK